MFHLQSLELLHWDYCQRVTLPLDGAIITIAGPNGSGKTTLLDAMRTLLGLECSGGRSYKTYARHANADSAWLRATVDNRPRNRQSSNRPFARCLLYSDVVTLGLKRCSSDLPLGGHALLRGLEAELARDLFGATPQRGDVVILTPEGKNQDYIKRVIGMPGDLFEMRDGQVFLNGKPVKQEAQPVKDLAVDANNPCTELDFPGALAQEASLQALAQRVEVSGETVFFYTHDSRALLNALQAWPALRTLHRPSNLEDLFLKLTGRQIREEG